MIHTTNKPKQTRTFSRAEARTSVRNDRQCTRRPTHGRRCRSCTSGPLSRWLPRRLGGGPAAWTVASDRPGGVARSGAVVMVATRAFAFRPLLHALGVRHIVLLFGVYAALKKN